MCRCNSRCYCNRNCNSNCPFMNNNNSNNMFANSCTNSNPFPENYLYGHAYTPVQYLKETYKPEVGLENGTIFPELVSSYYPGQSIDFIEFLRNGGNPNE